MNEAREKATVKLIPRIDLQAMASKFVIYCTIYALCYLRSYFSLLNFLEVFEERECNKILGRLFSFIFVLATITEKLCENSVARCQCVPVLFSVHSMGHNQFVYQIHEMSFIPAYRVEELLPRSLPLQHQD